MTRLWTSRDRVLRRALGSRRFVLGCVLLLLLVCVVASVVWVVSPGYLSRLALAVLLLSVGLVIVVVIAHQGREVRDRLRRLETLNVANHKRASVWNHYVMEGLRAQRALLAPTSPRLPTAASKSGTAARTGTSDSIQRPAAAHLSVASPSIPKAAADVSGADRLVASGVFDVQFYAAVANKAFSDELSAATHFLSAGYISGLSFSPFIDLEMLPGSVRAILRTGDCGALLGFLRSAAGSRHRYSELFDARFSGVKLAEAASHPGGVLGAYLAASDSETRLSVGPDSLVYGKLLFRARDSIVRDASRGGH